MNTDTDLRARAVTEANLPALRTRVVVPAYDRSEVSVGIVHIGVGGFHRAHQAMYVDRLMSRGLGREWGICGVGVLPGDETMRDALAAQDGLYTLILKGSDGTVTPRVIGSIVEYLLAPDDPEAVVERLCDPGVRIVSLTVPEGGYNLDPVTGEFDLNDADVAHDLEPGTVPTTSFGLVVEAIERRRHRGIASFTVMSCDNIPGNGDAARSSFVAFASARSAELGDFVRDQIRFPNSMVDRITPATTDEDRAWLVKELGYRGPVAGRMRALRAVGTRGQLRQRATDVRAGGGAACR